ncbi:PR-1-like protein [Glarea lozoyensis ATCC 20868]|uniref:PR-1-like protein n=1 Tax=Glarea lozoyensis (strain ATCC 20868 / MF5171) TaxID=1116229 RepID=S3CVZ5_GLAL2|nr:PR-1-like protein [Glarea lozoyensis ATCC 20868]EPE29114.1 PR-1-like protein [Glarea lozoyensis ATCC 20868]
MHIPSPFFLLLLTGALAMPKIVTITSIITIPLPTATLPPISIPTNIPVPNPGKAVIPGTSTGSTSYTDENIFQQDVLAAHNFYRRQHNASALVWNDTSAKVAGSWVKGCAFKHSNGALGENLVAGPPNATSAIDLWGQERQLFNFKSGGFSAETGHFTQLVWKDTTSVGCAVKNCKGLGWYTVCEYWPRGNVGFQGEDEDRFYRSNVQGQVQGDEGDTAVENAAVLAAEGTSGVAGVGGTTTSGSAVTPTETGKSEGGRTTPTLGLLVTVTIAMLLL